MSKDSVKLLHQQDAIAELAFQNKRLYRDKLNCLKESLKRSASLAKYRQTQENLQESLAETDRQE